MVFPMPQVHEILELIVYFRTLDLRSGYWQVEVDPGSIPVPYS